MAIKTRAKQVYKGFTPLNAQDIAETILFMVTRPKHVNIDDVLIMPTDQAFRVILIAGKSIDFD
jgi:3-hydroxy acid dehydrogenase / malonic semialdehyde reductase